MFPRSKKAKHTRIFFLVKIHKDELASLLMVLPMRSIVEEQIKDFNDLGIAAVKLTCDDETLDSIGRGKFQVIFGSAEGMLDEWFLKVLGNFHNHVKLIVIDECHTVETW